MASRNFHSLGETCVIVQMPPSRVRAIAIEKRLEMVTLNGIPHFSEADVDVIFATAASSRAIEIRTARHTRKEFR